MAKKIQVVVTTATALTSAQLSTIKTQLTKKIGQGYQLIQRVDPKLIGGITLAIDGQLNDASIGGKLKELESRLNRVRVVTAVPLTTSQKNKIKRSLKSKHGELEYQFQVDPQVIGGVKLAVGFNEFDATIKTKLNKLQTVLLEKF